MRDWLIAVVMAVSSCAVLCAAETKQGAAPSVSNRQAKPGEWGYRPADGSTSAVNPPSLIWLHEPEACTYAVQWARSKDFSGAVTVEQLPFNTYTHNAVWPAGTYWWRYRFTTKQGVVSDWSVARSVVVPAGAVEFPMPSRREQRQRAAAGRPRLFMRSEDLPRLRSAAAGPQAERFAKLRAEADRLLSAAPTPEPLQRGTIRDAQMRQFWWPNRVQTLKACQEAETLAFVYLMTGEKKYGEAARRWILHLASWDPDGPTNFALNDEAAMPLLHRLPRAYDWAYDTLSADDRAKVQQVMLRRATDVWKSGQVGGGVKHLTAPYNSHANRVWHKLAECAIAFLGEIPEADDWLDYAVNKFYAAYPVWSDDDGGWHEGLNYWSGYMSKVVWWLQVSRSALGIDGLRKPFFSQVGDFALYVAPPGSPNMGFGDISHGTPSKAWGEWLEYFLRTAPPGGHASYWRWWTEQWGMRTADGILGFLYATNLGPLPPARPPDDLPPSKVFRGIGVASLHSTLLDSREDVHLLFKSSPFGSQSHGHNPQNSFQLNAYGEALLTTCVYRDWHGSPFHYKWCHSTVAHNAVLVDGEGQVMHSAAATGRIADARLGGPWDYVVGDAAAAYGGRLSRCLRHVVFVKPHLIAIYDDLEAAAPATFQFMLHALRPFTVDERQASLVLEQPKAGVVVKYLPPEGIALKFRQWDGYEPKPERQFPNQWHVEAGTVEKTASMGMITVLAPYRAGQRRDLALARLDSATAVGVRVTDGGKTLATVVFRKAGTTGRADAGGLVFDGPVAVLAGR